MKLVLTSDTEGFHRELTPPDGDVLIHAGDIMSFGDGRTRMDYRNEFNDFLDWFTNQPHRYKIFIGGNHDEILQTWVPSLPENVFYLENSSIEIEGVTFWGSPNTVSFFGMPFEEDEEILSEIYSEIPTNVDVLITHVPPLGVLDANSRGKNCGSVSLSNILEDIHPKVHVFGHVHNSYGHVYHNYTDCYNASYLNNKNKPFTIEL